MRFIKKTATVPFSAAQMYDLVNDIASYPEYLPYCTGSSILSQNSKEIKACIQLAKSGVKQSFSTVNTLHPHKKIEISLLEGPFRHLKGMWSFEDASTGSGSVVHFELEFMLSSKLLDFAVGSALEGIANNFLDAFCERAKKVYG